MTILVTGATGYVGRLIANGLAAQGLAVLAVGRTEDSLAPLRDRAHLRPLAWDLSQPPPADLSDFSGVIHAAAHAPPRPETPSDLLRDNILATRNLAAAAIERGVGRFLFFSSISIYGDIRVPRVDEATEIRNPGPYGQSKLFCEHLLAELAPRLPSLALRLPGLVGPGAVTPWLARVVAQARERGAVTVFNAEAPFNNAVHMADLVAFLVQALERPLSGFDALTMAASGTTSVRGAVETLLAAAGVPATIAEGPSGRGSFIIDSTKAEQRYGYSPRPIAELLARFGAEMSGRLGS